MQTYGEYVARLAGAMEEAARLPLGNWPVPLCPPVAPGAPVVVLCSPHPDDEAITGGLALRLRRAAGWRVVNLAITLGSDPARRAPRAAELAACCRYLGFENRIPWPGGMTEVRLATRRTDPVHWLCQVDALAAQLVELQPRVVVVPHVADGHPAHAGTHGLVQHALLRARDQLAPLHLVESEYWHPMEAPNLLVESTAEEVADLLAALSCHAGEVRRNPYHVTLPAWMADNVRRGSERVGGAGAAAAPFRFGTLYGWQRWTPDGLAPTPPGRCVANSDDLAALFGP